MKVQTQLKERLEYLPIQWLIVLFHSPLAVQDIGRTSVSVLLNLYPD